METQKTILLPVYDTTVAKNILRTKVLSLLRTLPNVRIVILPPTVKIEQYAKEFADGKKVFVEEEPLWKHSFTEFAFGALFKHSIPTRVMQIRQGDWYRNQDKHVRYLFASVLRHLGRYSWWRKILTGICALEPIRPHVKKIYNKWNHDLVFATNMIPRDEVAFMRLARKAGKPVVGMVKSFDHLTSKSYLRIFPDYLLVPSKTGVEEAVKFYKFPREHAVPTGIPQYDAYIEKDIFEERESFIKKLGLNPDKRTVLNAPAGDWMNPNDKETLEILLNWIKDGTLPDTQVLLRLHPAYDSRTVELEGDPNMVVEKPGQHYGFYKSYEFFDADVRHLASSLKYSDIVINTASTLMVEGAIFDTPVVALGFDGYDKKDYWHSVVRYYDREHCAPVVKSGGVRLVCSKEEFLDSLKDYFAHPEHDEEGRKRAVEAVCYKIDGKAGERIVEVIRKALHD